MDKFTTEMSNDVWQIKTSEGQKKLLLLGFSAFDHYSNTYSPTFLWSPNWHSPG